MCFYDNEFVQQIDEGLKNRLQRIKNIFNPNSPANKAEFLLWKTKWTMILQKETPSDSDANNALFHSNLDFFIQVLNVLGALPVSTSTPEHFEL